MTPVRQYLCMGKFYISETVGGTGEVLDEHYMGQRFGIYWPPTIQDIALWVPLSELVSFSPQIPDRYEIMQMCWSDESTARPEFSELVQMLETVAKDFVTEPPNYVNITKNETVQNGSAVQHLWWHIGSRYMAVTKISHYKCMCCVLLCVCVFVCVCSFPACYECGNI